MAGFYMGKRHKTKVTVLRILGVFYYAIIIMLQLIIPYFINSSNKIYKMSINVTFLTYCLSNAIFSKYSLVYLFVYFTVFATLLFSFIMIIKGKYRTYNILAIILAIDIIFFVTHLEFYNFPLSFIGLIFKIIGCVICIENTRTNQGTVL